MKKLALASAMVLVSASAFALPPTTPGELATSVSFNDVALAILAVAGAVISLYVVVKGAKFVIAAVKGA